MKKAPVQFSSATANPELPSVTDIMPDDLMKRAGEVHIIDVRQPDEYTGELGHIAGSRLIVLDTLPENIESLPKDEPIVFVCLSGGRSARAAGFAQANGFSHVFNMKGGMRLWNQLGLATEV